MLNLIKADLKATFDDIENLQTVTRQLNNKKFTEYTDVESQKLKDKIVRIQQKIEMIDKLNKIGKPKRILIIV